MGAMSRLKVTCACGVLVCVVIFCCAIVTLPKPLASAAMQASVATVRSFRGATVIRDPKCSIPPPALRSRLAVFQR